jgi:hypothetical protein
MNERWIGFGACMFLLLACTTAAISADFQDEGDEGEFKDVIVWKMTKRQITFDHATHAAEYADDCTTCHHKSQEGEGQACRKCHPKRRNNPGDDTIVRIVAMHRQCKGCHKEMEAGPYAQCEECHVPRD